MRESSSVSSAPPQGQIRTHRDGHVLEIVIDRPQKYNGFTPEMLSQLSAAFAAYENDPQLWCALVRAEGKHFTAGLQLDRFDITAPLIERGQLDPLALREPRPTKPVVCAVKGICFTIGIELMLACDIVVAAEGTRFGQIEVKRGLMPFGGATIRMVERAGWGNAMRWLLTGDEFDAAEALRLGFVQEVVAPEDVEARARALAQRIAAQAPLAVQATRRSAELFVEGGPRAATAAFDDQLAALAASEDFAEGVKSFVERRDGDYKGR